MIDWSKVKTAEQQAADDAAEQQKKINEEARAYLVSTDWYVIRHQETGVPIPDQILKRRALSRTSVVE